jgi:hypothetical protein
MLFHVRDLNKNVRRPGKGKGKPPKQSMVYISANFTKIMPAKQYFTNEFYIEFHVNSTSGLTDDNRSLAEQKRQIIKVCTSGFSRKF